MLCAQAGAHRCCIAQALALLLALCDVCVCEPVCVCVQVVSGFAMTRERAEELLGPQPRGTFLLRFGSQVRWLAGWMWLSWGEPCSTSKPVAARSAPRPCSRKPLQSLLACYCC